MPSIPFRRLYTKQWEIDSYDALVGKAAYMLHTGRMPPGVESDDVLVTPLDGRFFLREGTHRVMAMILLGKRELLPGEYRWAKGKEHEDFVRMKTRQYPEMTSPQTVLALFAAYQPLILDAVRRRVR